LEEEDMNKLLFAVAFLFSVLTVAITANGAIFNLSADWSDTVNPMGAWSLYRNTTSLFTINQSDFPSNGAGQNAWADQPCYLNAHVPVWMKSDVDGKIYTHGAEYDRTGSNVTFARWTSPEDGTVTISGSVWTAALNRRTMGWNLRYEGANITGGTLYSDGRHGAANPVLFSQGSGGSGVLTFSVEAGQAIDLVFTSISESGNLGEMLGLDLTINIPEPTTIALLGLGILSLRRKK
jgi:hypothetical protein